MFIILKISMVVLAVTYISYKSPKIQFKFVHIIHQVKKYILTTEKTFESKENLKIQQVHNPH